MYDNARYRVVRSDHNNDTFDVVDANFDSTNSSLRAAWAPSNNIIIVLILLTSRGGIMLLVLSIMLRPFRTTPLALIITRTPVLFVSHLHDHSIPASKWVAVAVVCNRHFLCLYGQFSPLSPWINTQDGLISIKMAQKASCRLLVVVNGNLAHRPRLPRPHT